VNRKRAKEVKQSFNFFEKTSSNSELETFLDLICNEGSELLALDFLNCYLVLNKKNIISDYCIKYVLDFDIIKKYSPKKRKTLN